MRFEINFENMPEYVLIQTEGEAGVRDFDDLLNELVESPRWVTGTSQIVDHRKLKLDNLDSEAMMQIRDVVGKHSGKLGSGRCAFIVKDDLGFGIARMYDLVGGENLHHGVKVFYSIEDAVEWLRQNEPS